MKFLFPVSLVVSLAVHAILAIMLSTRGVRTVRTDAMPRLDVSHVELSVAERQNEKAVPAVEVSAPDAPFNRRNPEMKPPVLPNPDESVPPVEIVEAAVMPKPDAPHVQFETPTVEAPRQARVEAPPGPARAIRPDYPREARLRGEQGRVTLQVDVTEKGTVADVRVQASSGFPALDESAIRAVRAARFTPAKSRGVAIAATVRLALEFRLK